jgi:magnesium transporter
VDPSENELLYLEDHLSLELGHLKDGLDTYEVPRLEVENSTYYIFTRVLSQSSPTQKTIPILFVLTKNFVLVLSAQPIQFLFDVAASAPKSLTTQPAAIFIEIFSKINMQFSQALHTISYKINQITQNVEEIENKDIIKLVNFENTLNDLLNIFTQTDEFFQLLLKKKENVIFASDTEYLEDIALEVGQLVSRCKSSLKSVTNVRNAYSTILTNNLNQVVKFFTSISVVLMIPTVIASFYGMNVGIPLSNHPFAFPTIIGITIVISILFLWLLYRKKLL